MTAAVLDMKRSEYLIMEDMKDGYDIKRNKVNKHLGFELLPRINSGLALVERSCFQLHKIERYLEVGLSLFDKTWTHKALVRTKELLSTGRLAEQTINALLWSQELVRFLPRSYACTKGSLRFEDLDCRHYLNLPGIRQRFFSEGIPWLCQKTNFLDSQP